MSPKILYVESQPESLLNEGRFYPVTYYNNWGSGLSKQIEIRA